MRISMRISKVDLIIIIWIILWAITMRVAMEFDPRTSLENSHTELDIPNVCRYVESLP